MIAAISINSYHYNYDIDYIPYAVQALPSWCNHLPQSPPCKSVTLKVRFQHMNFRRRHSGYSLQVLSGEAHLSGVLSSPVSFQLWRLAKLFFTSESLHLLFQPLKHFPPLYHMPGHLLFFMSHLQCHLFKKFLSLASYNLVLSMARDRFYALTIIFSCITWVHFFHDNY